LVGPARLRVGSVGAVTTVRLDSGTLLAEFDGGAGRELHVEAPGMRVDVVGTLFEVRVAAGKTCVSVAHGRVHAVAGGGEVVVEGGQRACTAGSAIAPAGEIETQVRQALERHAVIVAEAG